ncbi:MAG TPA: hypothetical protein VFA46_10125 [Actinomycetes bacterium]|jgi:hypothetical protein|nr:hypothetical protein [Actinomycetes bacterium]
MRDLAWWLDNFERSAFRLETLPEYNVPQEAEWLEAFKRDGSLPRLSPENDSWLKLVSSCGSQRKQLQRVRIVRHPLSDYLRFELALFQASVASGEEIRVTTEHRFGCGDFWLFDSHTVILLRYDTAGRFLETEQPEDSVPYCRIRDLALERSIPLGQYLARATR